MAGAFLCHKTSALCSLARRRRVATAVKMQLSDDRLREDQSEDPLCMVFARVHHGLVFSNLDRVLADPELVFASALLLACILAPLWLSKGSPQ